MKRIAHRRRSRRPPPLTEEQILAWADAFFELHGRWPKKDRDGWVPGTLSEKWANIDMALRLGLRGLPGGSSLARLLAERRGVRNHMALPRLRLRRILAWADAYHQRTGLWPNSQSGLIEGTSGETWMAVNVALIQGNRGLPGGSSLAQLLSEARGVRNPAAVPNLSVQIILAWADAHYARTGHWPRVHSGPIVGTPGETWAAVQTALQKGQRGLPGGSSLAQLLAEHRSARNHKGLPRLRIKQILAWIDAYRQATGRWPNRHSGPIAGSDGETWAAIDAALSQGGRGLPGGSSLPGLLADYRGVRNIHRLSPLRVQDIRSWAREHHQHEGCWPTRESGPIPGSGGESWAGVDSALKRGGRGLPGGSSLSRLLASGGR